MAKLTVRSIEAARPKLTAYRLTVDRNLYLRVAVDGVKTWHVRYVVNSTQIEVRLSEPYGTGNGYMSLAEANAENAKIQGLARKGIDFKKLILPLLSVLHRLPIMRTSCLAAGPRSSVAQTSSG
jgi:hypothetical protein